MANTKYKKNARGEFETRIWDGTYNPDGSKHRKKLTSRKSSADLERQVEELRRSVKEQGAVVFSGISVGEYALQWLEVTKSAKADKTQDMYRAVVTRNLASIAGVRVSDLRHSHFQQVINLYLDHPRTCQQISLTFKQIVRAAVRDRLLPRTASGDILDGISLPTYVRKPRRPLTAIEKEAIMNAELDLVISIRLDNDPVNLLRFQAFQPCPCVIFDPERSDLDSVKHFFVGAGAGI